MGFHHNLGKKENVIFLKAESLQFSCNSIIQNYWNCLFFQNGDRFCPVYDKTPLINVQHGIFYRHLCFSCIFTVKLYIPLCTFIIQPFILLFNFKVSLFIIVWSLHRVWHNVTMLKNIFIQSPNFPWGFLCKYFPNFETSPYPVLVTKSLSRWGGVYCT